MVFRFFHSRRRAGPERNTHPGQPPGNRANTAIDSEAAAPPPRGDVSVGLRVAVGVALVGVGLLLAPLVPAIGQAKKLNPHTGNPEAIKEGRELYLQNGCSGCHGVMGGGGMGPPLLDDVWVFGSDDETLFKLIKGGIPQQTMPKVFAALPDDQVWKILAYIRSLYKGDPSKIDW